MNMLCLV